ncbi:MULTISPECIES: serine hydrolase [unclassified Sphingomonas]|uniref:serine hydrolase n=1 Tax=unclassified Sphingomonas TaxID=196159 RepID=UPI00044B4DF7|nr:MULTISPECIES: serine hydrolase [unclassified Sphingomonas]EZP50764.1 Beta-lactamase precursor [Sphingomonas sp. RIT328]
MRLLPLPRLLACCLAAGLLLPAPAQASSPALIGLERTLSALVAAWPGDYGIAALDLRDGSTVSINGDIAYPMASTVKLAIAGAYLTDVDRGRRRLTDVVAGRSAAQLMELMIVRSDNHAADQLLAAVGGPVAVQQWLATNGIAGIRVDRTIAQLLREPGHVFDSKDVATPNAMVALLDKLNGPLLSAESRGLLFGLMSRCATGTRRIRALLPAGTRVEDKTGTLDGVTNDVGFITMPDGRRLAVAVFARGGRDRQPGIAAVARAIYDRFADAERNALTLFLQLK